MVIEIDSYFEFQPISDYGSIASIDMQTYDHGYKFDKCCEYDECLHWLMPPLEPLEY